MTNYHLKPIRGRWKLSSERSDVIFAGFASRTEAIEFCTELMRNKAACLTVHRPDGTVIEERRYCAPQAA
jgi:hypothetical protein